MELKLYIKGALNIAIFGGFLIVRLILQYVEAAGLWLLGLYQALDQSKRIGGPSVCQISRILYRRLACDADFARPMTFLTFHQHLGPADILLDPHWMIYTMDSAWIYLVYVPAKTIKDYHAREVPFVYLQQFPDAEKVAKISIWSFTDLAKKLGPIKTKIVYVSNQPRSGTTLFSSMLQVSDKIFSLSEPDIFTHIPRYKGRCLTRPVTVQLIKAVFTFMCRNMDETTMCIVKPQANGTHICCEIQDAIPNAKHVFIYRKNIEKAAISCEKMMVASLGENWKIVMPLWKWAPAIAESIFGFLDYEPETRSMMYPNDAFDMGVFYFLTPLATYLQAKEAINFHAVEFESMIEQPREVLRDVFNVLGISEHLIDEGVKVMNRDSQSGSPLSQEKMSKVISGVLSPSRKKFYNRICVDVLGMKEQFS